MKKQLLFGIAIGVSMSSFAQQGSRQANGTAPKIKPALAKQAAPYRREMMNDNVAGIGSATGSQHQTKAYTNTSLAFTSYDLQTNSSIPNRAVMNPDGTISVAYTWSASTVASGNPDRGTGYSYFNGTSWSAAPTARIESVRTGWPNIGVTAAGKEISIAHLADGSGHDLIMSSRLVKGTGSWTETALGIPDTWPRMAIGGANGMTIHLIAQTKGAAPTNPPYMGQDGAISYSRSLDGGLTWDLVRTVIPQMDSTQYKHFSGDDYNITAKGDTIAIVVGGLDVDCFLLKSIDNGTTWTKTVIKQFAIPMFDPATMISDTNGDAVADTLDTNDGSVEVLLDHSGVAHVWYGNMRMIQTAPNAAGVSYFPFTDGLMYWNENMGSAAPVMIAAANDLNGNGTLDVGAIGTYYVSLSSMPSASIDPAGHIFVSYASIYEGPADDGTVGGTSGGKSYRHTYIMRSDDNGATWCTPQDVTDPEGPTHQDFIEGVFGALTEKSDNFVHLFLQKDSSPGHGLSGTPPGSTDPQSSSSEIVYVKVPVADLACGVGVNDLADNGGSMSLYPNPASGEVQLDLNIGQANNSTISIYNMMGQKIQSIEKENLKNGSNVKLNVAGFVPGVYFVNVLANGKTFSQKLMIK